MYEFDPYDTPPLLLRAVLCLVCLVGATVVSVSILRARSVEHLIAVIAGLLLAGAFIATASSGVKAATAAVLFWALLGAISLLAPV